MRLWYTYNICGLRGTCGIRGICGICNICGVHGNGGICDKCRICDVCSICGICGKENGRSGALLARRMRVVRTVVHSVKKT